MQEVTIRLRFTNPCLGFAPRQLENGRRDVIYRMPRDGQGRVIFLTSWWHSRMLYAAKVTGVCYNKANRIDWSQPVDGSVTQWRRTVATAKEGRRQRYALHESFRPGAEIGINAVLPDSITIDEFTTLLTVIGTYKGISPFQCEDATYGTFEVLSVMPTVRQLKPMLQKQESQ